MKNTYYQSAHGVKIDCARAIQEIRKHGIIENADFLREVKADENGLYDAQDVLKWLGY